MKDEHAILLCSIMDGVGDRLNLSPVTVTSLQIYNWIRRTCESDALQAMRRGGVNDAYNIGLSGQGMRGGQDVTIPEAR